MTDYEITAGLVQERMEYLAGRPNRVFELYLAPFPTAVMQTVRRCASPRPVHPVSTLMAMHEGAMRFRLKQMEMAA